MVAKQHSLERSAKAIQDCLIGLVKNGSAARVGVSTNQWGHLDVVIGTDKYKELDVIKRDDIVWDHMKKNLDPADLANIGDVRVLSLDEYEACLRMQVSFEKYIERRSMESE